LVAVPHAFPAHVVPIASGTQVHTAGAPEHASVGPHAVQRAGSSQPFCASVGTHFWLQFFVPAGHAPTTHLPAEHASVPPHAAGQPAALHWVAEQPWVGSFTLTHLPPQSLNPVWHVMMQRLPPGGLAPHEAVPFVASHASQLAAPHP
jgi:hypothetical protein